MVTTIVRKKGSINSHTLLAPPKNNNVASDDDFSVKIDVILRAIRGYKGKVDATTELVLEIQIKFNDKLEALEQDNNLIRTQFI